MQHLTKNNILYNHQHGCRSKLLTEIQLIEFTEDILRGMKDGKQSEVVVMDFANVFDSLTHQATPQIIHVWKRPRDIWMVPVLSLW